MSKTQVSAHRQTPGRMPCPRGPSILFATVTTLAIAAIIVLAVSFWVQGRPETVCEEFQRLVGGLGLGPAVDLSRCDFSFDPRLCHGCPEDLGPIPGGAYFCPHHACSIFCCKPSLDQNGRPPVEAKRDAEVP